MGHFQGTRLYALKVTHSVTRLSKDSPMDTLEYDSSAWPSASFLHKHSRVLMVRYSMHSEDSCSTSRPSSCGYSFSTIWNVCFTPWPLTATIFNPHRLTVLPTCGIGKFSQLLAVLILITLWNIQGSLPQAKPLSIEIRGTFVPLRSIALFLLRRIGSRSSIQS